MSVSQNLTCPKPVGRLMYAIKMSLLTLEQSDGQKLMLRNTQWSYPTRLAVMVIGLIGLVWLLVVASPLVQALIVAVLLAYLLAPIVRLIQRDSRLSYEWSARVVYVLFLAVLGAIPAALSTVAVSQFHLIEEELFIAFTELSEWLTQPIFIFGFGFQPLAILDNLEESFVNTVGVWSSNAVGTLLNVTANLLWGLTALVSLYYFLVEAQRIKPALVRLIPDDYKDEIYILLDEIDTAWRIFLRAQLIIFLILTALLLVSTLLVLGLYRAGLLPLSPIGLIVLLAIVYTLVQQVDNIWLRPYFFGDQLKLHPGLVFVSLIGALALGSILTVIIIVPCLAAAKVIGRYVHRKLLGLPPWPQLETSQIQANSAEAAVVVEPAVAKEGGIERSELSVEMSKSP